VRGAWLLPAAHLLAVELRVAPQGDDGNPGTRERPLATLQGARDAVRKLRPLGEIARVRVRPGLYVMEEPLVLSPEDSGSAGAPVVYEAAAEERPVFTARRSRNQRWRRGGARSQEPGARMERA
jgi:hypothetical protein